MEDMFCVAYQPTADEKDLLYAYFGIFDGHGGREAALYAKQHLMDHIVSQKNFWSDDDQLVLKAIREGFISTHYAMWKDLGMLNFKTTRNTSVKKLLMRSILFIHLKCRKLAENTGKLSPRVSVAD